MVIENVVSTDKFIRDVKRLKDKNVRNRIEDVVKRIITNPGTGKPLKYGLRGERTVRIPPYRLIYAVTGSKLFLLRFEHRDEVYG